MKLKVRKHMSNFDEWNGIKKRVDHKKIFAQVKERDIFWLSIGKNIGFEQNSKDDSYIRPVLILQKFSNHVFLGIPRTSVKKMINFTIHLVLINKQKVTQYCLK